MDRNSTHSSLTEILSKGIAQLMALTRPRKTSKETASMFLEGNEAH